MKHTVRAFSVGLIAAGVLLLGIYFLFDAKEESAASNTEEMIAEIEADGFRVITEEEYISYSVANGMKNKEANEEVEEDTKENETTDEAEEVDEDQPEKVEEESKEEEKEETPSSVTITIESGMPTSRISNLLEEKGIVEDASAFTDYLDEHDYTLRIRMGEYELQTGMSHYEIAEMLTK